MEIPKTEVKYFDVGISSTWNPESGYTWRAPYVCIWIGKREIELLLEVLSKDDPSMLSTTRQKIEEAQKLLNDALNADHTGAIDAVIDEMVKNGDAIEL